ncbi:MAG: aspartate carbamoyltransferase regulatory subunit [Candidatus Diapherotrites archaeon]|nr:aspartate carbamoyltransferase regulatory subunit [Candidatus Diapherotrites archaeon]
MSEKKIHISPIKNGTAIDHLPVGTSLKILEAINVNDATCTAAMNVESKKMGRKDILFIEGKELNETEMDKIRILGKNGTMNIIKDSKISKKESIDYPNEAKGILTCANEKCITNKEGLITKFSLKKNPLSAKCFYCEKSMDKKEIMNSIKKG